MKIKISKAFTLIELIAVIVIMGFVAFIGAEVISSMYENYIRSRSLGSLESKTELVLEQLSKKLQNRVRPSVGFVRAGNVLPLEEAQNSDKNLIWISSSAESRLQASDRAGWSGVLDLDTVNGTARTVITPGSDLNYTSSIVSRLSKGVAGGEVNFNVAGADSVGFIPKSRGSILQTARYWNIPTGGANLNSYIVRVIQEAGTGGFRNQLRVTHGDTLADINPSEGGTQDIYEQYILAHTAYAIERVIPASGSTKDFQLWLRYNFRPWDGDNIAASIGAVPGVGARSLLAEHVSTFRFRKENGSNSIRIKLCIADTKSTNFEFSACKEMVVF